MTQGCRWCSARRIRPRARSYAASRMRCRRASAALRGCRSGWTRAGARRVPRSRNWGSPRFAKRHSSRPLLEVLLPECRFAARLGRDGQRTDHPHRADGRDADPDGGHRNRRAGDRRLARAQNPARASQDLFRRRQQAGRIRRRLVQGQQGDRTSGGSAGRRASAGLARGGLGPCRRDETTAARRRGAADHHGPPVAFGLPDGAPQRASPARLLLFLPRRGGLPGLGGAGLPPSAERTRSVSPTTSPAG